MRQLALIVAMTLISGPGASWLECVSADELHLPASREMERPSSEGFDGAAYAQTPAGATLVVRKILIPSNDPGRFDLTIDGAPRALGVGNNGATPATSVTFGPHEVAELASAGTNLADYATVIGGDCNSGGFVVVHQGQHKACTITNTRKPISHIHSWTQGPGTYQFTVCAAGPKAACSISGVPGQSIPITFEVWGAGGGGGGGFQDFNSGSVSSTYGGPGGGGGGGGGYGKTTISTTVPPIGSVAAFSVSVGAGGSSGTPGAPCSQAGGGIGGFTEVRLGGTSGTIVVKATGGTGGLYGGNCSSAGSAGGAGGIGSINNWGGLVGGNGAVVTTCNGGAGGSGGPGGGPGRTGAGYINDGGDGGHGGYLHRVVSPTCTAHGLNWELTDGHVGGNGFVKVTW